MVLNPGTVASCTEYAHLEKCSLVVHSVSVMLLKVIEEATVRGLRVVVQKQNITEDHLQFNIFRTFQNVKSQDS